MSVTELTPKYPLIGASHEDGDLVLATGERKDEIEENFLVHKALMALHSPVLRDMLENADPVDVTGPMNNVPVVRCYDSASDIRILLCALYNGL